MHLCDLSLGACCVGSVWKACVPIMCRRRKAWERYLCTHIYRKCCIAQHPPLPASVASRDAREGWRLLTVETEADGGLWSTNERGPFLVGSLGSSCRTRYSYPALAALVSPVQNIFSSPHFMCPYRLATWAVSRAGSPVSYYVSLVASHGLVRRDRD
jgi:hypothetical protein